MVFSRHNVHKYIYMYITCLIVGFGDITPNTVLGRIIGVIVCLVGVFILSLLVVTLTIFTDLDQDELLAYNDISSLSTSFDMMKEFQEYVRGILVSRFKYKFKRMDLECVTSKYSRNLKRVQFNIEMNKSKSNRFTYDEFIKNVRDLTEEQINLLCEGFTGVWNFEEHVNKI
jgi:hypothetical protein